MDETPGCAGAGLVSTDATLGIITSGAEEAMATSGDSAELAPLAAATEVGWVDAEGASIAAQAAQVARCLLVLCCSIGKVTPQGATPMSVASAVGWHFAR